MMTHGSMLACSCNCRVGSIACAPKDRTRKMGLRSCSFKQRLARGHCCRCRRGPSLTPQPAANSAYSRICRSRIVWQYMLPLALGHTSMLGQRYKRRSTTLSCSGREAACTRQTRCLSAGVGPAKASAAATTRMLPVQGSSGSVHRSPGSSHTLAALRTPRSPATARHVPQRCCNIRFGSVWLRLPEPAVGVFTSWSPQIQLVDSACITKDCEAPGACQNSSAYTARCHCPTFRA